MERLHQLFLENDPQGYYSIEEMNELCKDHKFEMIFEYVQNIFDTNQIITPEIRDYLLNSNYNADTVLKIEEQRQNYGMLYNIDNWENHLTYYNKQQ